MKTCPKCGETDQSAFYASSGYCKTCHREAVRKHRLKKIGVTYEDYEERIKDLGNKCEVCGKDANEIEGGKRGLHFDHDHETLKPRGILCSRCNQVLGHVKDSVPLLGKLMWYLMKYRKAHSCEYSTVLETQNDTPQGL